MEKPLCALPDGSCLIETFGWTPDEGVARLDLHLARLAASAKAFGVRYDVGRVHTLLEDLKADTALRCRLTVGRDGSVDLTTAPLPAPPATWTIAISEHRLDSQDIFLRHKTSQRALYDAARADLPSGVDELVFLNERDELCEGTITNILVRLGERWVTPALTSGCLPGVYRQSLLNAGKVSEDVVSVHDLQMADEFRLCNSLRGEIPARFLD